MLSSQQRAKVRLGKLKAVGKELNYLEDKVPPPTTPVDPGPNPNPTPPLPERRSSPVNRLISDDVGGRPIGNARGTRPGFRDVSGDGYSSSRIPPHVGTSSGPIPNARGATGTRPSPTPVMEQRGRRNVTADDYSGTGRTPHGIEADPIKTRARAEALSRNRAKVGFREGVKTHADNVLKKNEAARIASVRAGLTEAAERTGKFLDSKIARYGGVGLLGMLAVSNAKNMLDRAQNRDMTGAMLSGTMAGAAAWGAYRFHHLGKGAVTNHLSKMAGKVLVR